MKKKIISIIVLLSVLFSIYYYWNYSYVKLYPVKLIEEEYVIITEKSYPDFYENIVFVLDNYNEDYIIDNGIILIKRKKMRDLELIYNYTNKANDSAWMTEVKKNK